MALIFDLDQTLIDSSIAEPYRKSRKWDKVYSLIPKFNTYPGVNSLLEWLDEYEIPKCIVTSSPRPYCNGVLDHYCINFSALVCYHDTRLHKPNPEPILKGIELLGTDGDKVLSIGDQAKDILASKRAGVVTVAATWGSDNIDLLLESSPDFICHSVDELQTLLSQWSGRAIVHRKT